MAELEQKPDDRPEDKLEVAGPDEDEVEIEAAGEDELEGEIVAEATEDEGEIEEKKLPKWPPLTSFDDPIISAEVREAVQKIGWLNPTPVQGMCLPYTLRNRDVAGFAQTGTGKTGVFLITVAECILRARAKSGNNNPVLRAVVLAPTRELALQIQADSEALLNQLGIKSLAVFGGIDYEKQAQVIKQGVDLILATPGRIKDYHQKKIVQLKELELFVCDEADRMFDMGFIEDVRYFYERLNPKTQRLLFSATTNDNVSELAFEYLETPEYISVNPEVLTPERITQAAYIVEAKDKLKVLLGLFQEQQPACAIIFTNTKVVAEWLHYKLQNNAIEASILTGDLPQRKRIALIQQIKEGKMKALIATDVASRGLHISGVTHVYNFDIPEEAANYVHRIGRTARAGASGVAVSLVCEDYGQHLPMIQDLLGPQIPLTCSWPNPEFLNIVDKAGSPYKDPGFKSSSSRKLPGEDKRRPSRDGEESRKEGRYKKRAPEDGAVATPARRQQAHLKDTKLARTDAQAPRKRELPKQSAHPAKIIKPKSQTLPVAKGQQSLWALVKKFFSALFGKKS